MHIDVPDKFVDRGTVKTQVMVTGYGGTYLSKRDYIIEALQEQTEKKKLKIDRADYGIIVNACIRGMEIAFPAYSELNDWFKQVANAACKAGNQEVSWTSPNGSRIVQVYNEPDWHEVRTYAANGANYGVLMSTDNDTLWLQRGFTDEVRVHKHCSAIAANFTHTLDACMIQEGLLKIDPSIDVYTVHDCQYSVLQGGQLSRYFREAFLEVVTTPVLQHLLQQNDIADTVELLETQDTDPSVCLESEYMFS